MRRIALVLALAASSAAAQERKAVEAGPDVELTVYLVRMAEGAEADTGPDAVPKELEETVARLKASEIGSKRSFRLAETFRMRASTVVDAASPSGRALLLREPSITRTRPDAQQKASGPTVDSLRVASLEFLVGGTIRLNFFEISFQGLSSQLGGKADLPAGQPQMLGMVGGEPAPVFVLLAARAAQ